ncbi:hypothetical protein AAL_07240 [Moelleriella libera RCEF 2490]|uniref:RZ-type domain-containing protein n=1 Tax=Moelleriella libera RCEF 2490 TaxID=1081109 RepID=A0A167XWD8_9HYPO|nr:hypothetical protein AAL_07240 [Moelleriella libera RCEF 2490]
MAGLLWSGALRVLNGDEREWKQRVPRDLDDEEYYGREHIKAIADLRARPGNMETFTQTLGLFLKAMTHSSLLDCLSVDTFVGGLYNFLGGANGTRAVPLFQHLCKTIVTQHVEYSFGTTTTPIQETLAALSTALRELLQREPRVRLNDDITSLIDSIEQASEIMLVPDHPRAEVLVSKQVREMRGMVAGANRLVAQEDEKWDLEASTSWTSSYPSGTMMPKGHHDNDKRDIREIQIFPTHAEIMSDEAVFLPASDLNAPHFLSDLAERHIDTQFRLLRHDSFGELKDALARLMDAAEKDANCLQNPTLRLGDFRAHLYSSAVITSVSFDSRKGLEVEISFKHPFEARNKSSFERRKWWDDSKRLAGGVLLSFLAVQGDETSHLFLTAANRSTDAKENSGPVEGSQNATIKAKLTCHDRANTESVLRLIATGARGILIEFPGVLPGTFVPILQNLQNMQHESSLPFRDWILPNRTGSGSLATAIPPPLYARESGFRFSLKSILKPGLSRDLHIDVGCNSTMDEVSIIDEMERSTDLDHGQCQALFAALTREFTLIQGPPGTGKSYLGIQLMKVLLDCKNTASLGPIVVVCYTNHALDQFLEHLLTIGITKTIRMGGQSHSDRLEGHNLRFVSQLETKSRSENSLLAASYQNLESIADRIKSILRRAYVVGPRVQWENVEHLLLREYPSIHRQFSRIDDDGYETIGRHPFDVWAPSAIDSAFTRSSGTVENSMNVDGLVGKAVTDVHSLSRGERRQLIKFWSDINYKEAIDELVEQVREAEAMRQLVSSIHDEVDRRVLQEADVIGITTTGLAKRISILKRIKCKVIICEEAGEVMEPHIISALLPTVEHFIQIGDHEQLRPQINNFGLSMESKQGALYQLDRSQFERLSVGIAGRPNMPVAQLNVQRRMRPEISRLIRETVYPKIQDHSQTFNLPDVVGMRKNVCWLDHTHLEEGQHSRSHYKSHSNVYEADMVHALVRHIVRQGEYSSSDIAVLTPYTGQLQRIQAAMRNDFEVILSDRDQEALDKDGFHDGGIDASNSSGPVENAPSRRMTPLSKVKLSNLLRVATVDNFQGEEAKIVIVSLVRSNLQRKVGFLKTTNRINVLLSRAQHGMFLIGNTDTYSQIQMWQKVIDMLRACDSVNNSLGLCCPRHKEIPIEVSEPDDFPRFSPEGGICGETCPEKICKDCHMKQDARVDLLEMKTYAEIDVDETPIVVLGCGHFFTAETLDGLIGMNEVYTTNSGGQFTALADVSASLAKQIPKCPDCQRPVRQYVTQRYNRVINRAVIDESSKRFLLSGKGELKSLRNELEKLQEKLAGSYENFLLELRLRLFSNRRSVMSGRLSDEFQTRFRDCNALLRQIARFLGKVSERHQPAHRLHEATLHAFKANHPETLDEAMASLSLGHFAVPLEHDRQITLGGQMVQITVDALVLEEKLNILRELLSAAPDAVTKSPGSSVRSSAKLFFQTCQVFISSCVDVQLPKLAVEASLHHARIAALYQSYQLSVDDDRGQAIGYVADARKYLGEALELCSQPFQHAEELKAAVSKGIEVLQRERYERVTAEELAAIKQAMVSGHGGIATHSGHWYNCANGHPFAIGECGMPMEEARCPECGAAIGGSNHRSVAGVTRAEHMED